MFRKKKTEIDDIKNDIKYKNIMEIYDEWWRNRGYLINHLDNVHTLLQSVNYHIGADKEAEEKELEKEKQALHNCIAEYDLLRMKLTNKIKEYDYMEKMIYYHPNFAIPCDSHSWIRFEISRLSRGERICSKSEDF